MAGDICVPERETVLRVFIPALRWILVRIVQPTDSLFNSSPASELPRCNAGHAIYRILKSRKGRTLERKPNLKPHLSWVARGRTSAEPGQESGDCFFFCLVNVGGDQAIECPHDFTKEREQNNAAS